MHTGHVRLDAASILVITPPSLHGLVYGPLTGGPFLCCAHPRNSPNGRMFARCRWTVRQLLRSFGEAGRPGEAAQDLETQVGSARVIPTGTSR